MQLLVSPEYKDWNENDANKATTQKFLIPSLRALQITPSGMGLV